MGPRVHVAGLSPATTAQQLHELCAPYGIVKLASVIRSRNTGQRVGCGFVEMASPEAAEEVIAVLNGTQLDGQTLSVFCAP